MAAARRPFRRELCVDRGKIPKYRVPVQYSKSFCTVVVVRPECEIESYCTPSTLLCSQPTEQPTAERKVQEVEDEYMPRVANLWCDTAKCYPRSLKTPTRPLDDPRRRAAPLVAYRALRFSRDPAERAVGPHTG